MGRAHQAQEAKEGGGQVTSDRIRWCMRCNQISCSRKCPECRNDVLNLHIDKTSGISPIFQYQADHIRSKIDDNYGEGCGELLIPDDRTALFEIVHGHRIMIIDGGAVGRLYPSGEVTLNASGLSLISEKIRKNYVRCDHDSSFFVTKGRNLMVTGISEYPEGLSAGDVVAVLDHKGTPIAEGVMRMSSEELGSSDRGVAVNIREREAPRLSASRKHSDWVRTIDSNAYTMGALIGETVKNIKMLGSSYMYPFVVRLSPGIVSEADLLLVLEAGYRPSVILDVKDDFIEYLIGKHRLEVISEVPDRCILISERKEEQTLGIIPNSPTDDWDQSMVWMYIMMRSEPFDPSYMHEI